MPATDTCERCGAAILDRGGEIISAEGITIKGAVVSVRDVTLVSRRGATKLTSETKPQRVCKACLQSA